MLCSPTAYVRQGSRLSGARPFKRRKRGVKGTQMRNAFRNLRV
jgi:hypothetical protein